MRNPPTGSQVVGAPKMVGRAAHPAPDQARAVKSTALSVQPATRGDTEPAAHPAESAARAVEISKVHGSGEAAVRALEALTATFPKRQFTAIMGPSGSGKSTLMHCLAGLDTPTTGQVWLGERRIDQLSDRALTTLRRDRIGFVFQQFHLLPTLTAAENIALPLSIAGRRPDQDWLDQLIDAVGLADRLDHLPSQLSGGQQQRVACARALASRPDIVFADEPTGNLDSRSGAEVLGFLRRCVDDIGQTAVMVTHDASAASYADRVLFLADGKVVDKMRRPTAEKVLDRMKHLESRHV